MASIQGLVEVMRLPSGPVEAVARTPRISVSATLYRFQPWKGLLELRSLMPRMRELTDICFSIACFCNRLNDTVGVIGDGLSDLSTV